MVILYHNIVNRNILCQNTNNYTLLTVHKIMTSSDVTIKIY